MNQKEEHIAAAAVRVFSRYGVRRTTMNDIAAEAGVVRQTLYNIFPNKHAVIRGTVTHYARSQRERTQADWEGAGSLAERLDILFAHTVVTPWDLVHASPDANDLETAVSEAAADALADAEVEIRTMLSQLFEPYRARLSHSGQDPDALAHFVQGAMKAIKQSASDRATLLRLIETLKAATLSLTSEAKASGSRSTL